MRNIFLAILKYFNYLILHNPSMQAIRELQGVFSIAGWIGITNAPELSVHSIRLQISCIIRFIWVNVSIKLFYISSMPSIELMKISSQCCSALNVSGRGLVFWWNLPIFTIRIEAPVSNSNITIFLLFIWMSLRLTSFSILSDIGSVG